MLVFISLMIAGAALLGVWRALNAKWIQEGIKDASYKASFVVAGTFLAAAFFLGIAWLFLYSQGQIEFPRTGFLAAILITGFLNVGMNMCRFYSYGYADLGVVAPIETLSPVFMVLSAWTILQELPNSLGFVGIFSIVVGTYALNAEGHLGRKTFLAPFANIWKNLGTRLALLAAIFPVVSIVYDKKAVLTSDPITMSLALCLIVGFSALLYTTGQTKGKIGQLVSLSLTAKFLITGLVYAFTLFFFNTAIQMQIVPYVGALKRLSILVSIIVAYFLLKQKTDIKKRLIGSAVTVAGATFIALS